MSPPVPSPCTAVCRLDEATGWCLGCGRTIDEIVAWSTLDNRARREIWKLLPARRGAVAGVVEPGPVQPPPYPAAD